MKSRKCAGYPGAVLAPSTRSHQKTQAIRHDIHRLRVSFTRRMDEAGQRRAAREHKNATGRCECTGPQPFDQNTSLDPNSGQLK